MKYKEFINRSERKDASINDVLHFFSSHFKSVVAFALYKMKFSANLATLLFGLVGLSSAYSMYVGYYFIGYILFRLHIIIDMADGSIARAKSQFSEYADGYDKVNHVLVNTCVILALSKDANYLSLFLILPTFLVYYLFPKLFSKYPKGVNKSFDSILKTIFKNFLSFEGYILLQCVNSVLSLNLTSEINILYGCFFGFLSLLKYRFMVSHEK